ncbi:MAG: hypothetical protein ACJA1B_000881 [Polaribacter sp.]|jgi:hypothetical protein
MNWIRIYDDATARLNVKKICSKSEQVDVLE